MFELPSMKNGAAYLNKRKPQENINIDGAFGVCTVEREALRQREGKMHKYKVLYTRLCIVTIFQKLKSTWLKVAT